MKGVFDSKPTSIYADDTTRYQFPSNYLSIAEQTEGDWVLFRRPKRDGGDMSYYATGRVTSVKSDPSTPRMYFAYLEDYMLLPQPVPWTNKGRYWEQGLREIDSRDVGASMRGRSMRTLSETDFADIIAAGLVDALSSNDAAQAGFTEADIAAAIEAFATVPINERARRVEDVLTKRVVREVSFRINVRNAYDNRCAITRLRLMDGGRNPEAQAAHIWGVASGGPDVVPNGIALSGTVHWLFDRHFIMIGNDYRLIVAPSKIPDDFMRWLLNAGDVIHLPKKREDWPNPGYLAKHRALFEKKNEH